MKTPLDPWSALRARTSARIALGRAGGSLPTRELLSFKAAHAQARDAVHAPLDLDALERDLRALSLPVLRVRTRAADRQAYLLRPDDGRALHPDDAARLAASASGPVDLALVVADGLSATAVQENAAPFLAELVPGARALGLSLAPLVLATNGRVALQDEVGHRLGARVALTILGERPGLGAADSLGVYFVHGPRPGRTDADRNCLSNVRSGGLPPADAARKTLYLIRAALAAGLSGVALKDDGGTLLP